ncbi:MAG: SEC-C metal-binding domain-containing protein [bacterium]
MTITDIEEKKAEERRREKRLVHLANTLSREFTESCQLKSKELKTFTEYLAKSLLDYVFFNQHKEIGELNTDHIRHFILEYTPKQLTITKDFLKEFPTTLVKLLDFLNANGYIKNASQLKKVVNENQKEFSKIIQAKKIQEPLKSDKRTTKQSSIAKEGLKVGRNDPCPCGSGKKYKKCCGKNK